MDKFMSLLAIGLIFVAVFFALSRMADNRPALFRVTATHAPAPSYFTDLGSAQSTIKRLGAPAPRGAKIRLHSRPAPGSPWRLMREWTVGSDGRLAR